MTEMRMCPESRAHERKPALARKLHEAVATLENIAANASLLAVVERDEQERIWLADAEARALACADALRPALPRIVVEEHDDGVVG